MNAIHGAPAPATGRITGRVVLSGPKPPERIIEFDPTSAAIHGTNQAMTRHFVTGPGGGLGDVVIWIRDGASIPSHSRVDELSLKLEGALFQPYVLAAQTNQLIRFWNSDSLGHNIHVHVPKNAMNVGKNIAVPNAGFSTEFQFPRPDLFLALKCDVHPWELARLAIFDHPFFAVTKHDGSFELPPLAPGHYVVEARHLHAGSRSQEVEVIAGRASHIELRMPLEPNAARYAVRAGGPRSYNGISTGPESSRLRIKLWRDSNLDIHGRITSEEATEILVWNVRFQVPSSGAGTDGFGWDTIIDEFPYPPMIQIEARASFSNRSTLAPGETGEFTIREPTPFPWRLCLLYQTREARSRQCEAISNQIEPRLKISKSRWPAAKEVFHGIAPAMLRSEIERLLGPPRSSAGRGETVWYPYPPAAATTGPGALDASSHPRIGIVYTDENTVQSVELSL